MADSSFDIVSKIDRQEVDNALGQTAREIATRFDFKGTGATIEWQGEHAIEITRLGRRPGHAPCSTCSRTSWSSATRA